MTPRRLARWNELAILLEQCAELAAANIADEDRRALAERERRQRRSSSWPT
jgi:hypothetical protein